MALAGAPEAKRSKMRRTTAASATSMRRPPRTGSPSTRFGLTGYHDSRSRGHRRDRPASSRPCEPRRCLSARSFRTGAFIVSLSPTCSSLISPSPRVTIRMPATTAACRARPRPPDRATGGPGLRPRRRTGRRGHRRAALSQDACCLSCHGLFGQPACAPRPSLEATRPDLIGDGRALCRRPRRWSRRSACPDRGAQRRLLAVPSLALRREDAERRAAAPLAHAPTPGQHVHTVRLAERPDLLMPRDAVLRGDGATSHAAAVIGDDQLDREHARGEAARPDRDGTAASIWRIVPSVAP